MNKYVSQGSIGSKVDTEDTPIRPKSTYVDRMKIMRNMQISNPSVVQAQLAGKLTVQSNMMRQQAAQVASKMISIPLTGPLKERTTLTKYTPRKQITYVVKPMIAKTPNATTQELAEPLGVGKYLQSGIKRAIPVSQREVPGASYQTSQMKPTQPSSRQDHLIKADYSWIIRRGSRDLDASTSFQRQTKANPSISSLGLLGLTSAMGSPKPSKHKASAQKLIEEAQFVYRTGCQYVGHSLASSNSLGNIADVSLSLGYKQHGYPQRDDSTGQIPSPATSIQGRRGVYQQAPKPGLAKDKLRISTELAEFMRMQLARKAGHKRTGSKRSNALAQPGKSKVFLGIPSKVVVIPQKDKNADEELQNNNPTVWITRLMDGNDAEGMNRKKTLPSQDVYVSETQLREGLGSVDSHRDLDILNDELISVRSAFQSEINGPSGRQPSAKAPFGNQKYSVPEISDIPAPLTRFSSASNIGIFRCRTQNSPQRKPSASPMKVKMNKHLNAEELRAAPLAGWGPSAALSRNPHSHSKQEGEDDHTVLDLEEYLSRTAGQAN